jgi:gas vesicle protein
MDGLGGIIFGWVLLSLICGAALQNKKMGFWGTFLLCILISPLLGVIISAVSGDKDKPKTNNTKKKEILNQIEELKKEEDLDLISAKGKEKLEELVETYKSYDDNVKVKSKYNSKKQEEINRKMRSRLAIILFILFGLLALATIISSFA